MKCVVFLFIALLLTTSQATAELQDDLVLYFTFDNVKGKKVLDDSDNGLDAEVVANVDFVEGKYGNAMHIAAEPKDNDCVHVPADDLLKIGGEITMMAWVYHEDWDTVSGQLFDNGNHILDEREKSYGLGLFPDPEHFEFLRNFDDPNIVMDLGGVSDRGEEGAWRFWSGGPMVDKKWHHITGTYDGRIKRIYLDGEIRSDRKEDFEFIGTNDSNLRIGCAKDHPQYTFKNGSIDEVGLWRRALTQSEILQVMGGALAVSPKNKIATMWGDIKRSVWRN
ncbi:MAG: LamG domain-containing protein [Candidatus Poribacteria bacterium]|nr:LamG domain-containing protein [Candidatus Poribacteria bacterium]